MALDVIGLPELLVIAFVSVLVLGASRLPRLLDGLQEEIRGLRDYLLGHYPLRPVDRSDHCGRAVGLRCGSCGRITRKGGYALLAVVAAASALAVIWHVAMPVL